MLTGMDKDRLEALRRQVEEDYRLDIAAIERLQRRCVDGSSAVASNAIPSSSVPAHIVPNSFDSSPSAGPGSEWRTDQRTTILPPSGLSESQNDDLVGTLRSMFNGNHR